MGPSFVLLELRRTKRGVPLCTVEGISKRAVLEALQWFAFMIKRCCVI